jgi:MerR family transcriptional regulator, copper efflux regulator
MCGALECNVIQTIGFRKKALTLKSGRRFTLIGVSTTYKINEVARRSGFSATTLRYYEDIGLMPAPDRTESGYRMYDAAAIDRLAFIARAKQLGCTLDETADLLVAWEGGRCGPVQDRLRTLVSSKVADASRQIAELTTLRLELRAASAALEGHRPDGPCDDSCGCGAPSGIAAGALGASPVRLTAKPSTRPDRAVPPIVCTATAESATAALYAWRVLLAAHEGTLVRTAIDGGVRLQFGPDVDVAELARLTMAEQDCCRFFSFAITVDERGVGLDVRAPDDAMPIVHTLFGGSE